MLWTRRDATIVVGVDGTEASRAALAFALREGAARGSTVEVVTAWETPTNGVDVRSLAQAAQDEAVADALATVSPTPVISRTLVEEHPAAALVSASRGAAFLVVGRGRKGVAREGVMGSVGEYCIRHAHCPVTVVPPLVEEGEQPETSVLSAPALTA